VTLSAGTRLGPYEILAPLGAGGMGEVYRAKDPRLGREVAIKVLPASLANDAERLRRFESEARSASALNHPNIVTIHEIGAANGISYIAMELVDGPSLRDLLAEGPLPTKRLFDIAVQIAEALAKAHGAGIVHRDLKPENVIVSKDGYVKLLDFGLAKLFVAPTEQVTNAPTIVPQETSPGTVMGTVGYMSPEQASGKPVDFRSDQFSFGSILYETATGKRAFQRNTGAEMLTAIIRDEPEPVAQANPRAPAPLRWIVERCLAKDPDERYASTRDLARDLKSVREHIGEVTSTASGAASVVEPVRRRSRWPLDLAALVAVGLLGLYAGRKTSSATQPTFQRLTFQRGTVSSARFAPDGTGVYYTAAWDGNSSRIYSLRPGTPESSVLPLASAMLLSISPGGEMAVLLDPDYTINGFALTGTLARVPLSGAAPREVLANVSFAEWAPGGSEVAVVHYVSGKNRLEYPIGKVLFETAGWIGNPRFSPDGRSIAFIEHPSSEDGGAVCVVGLGEIKKTNLTDRFATVQGLAWSPEGREIWFTAAREGIERMVYGVTPAGRLRLVRTMQGTPALLDVRADGAALITEDDYRAGMLLFGPGQPGGKDLTWFDWSTDRGLSADGKLVLFDESGEGGGANAAVYLRSSDGAAAVRLGEHMGMALSPDAGWAMTRSLSDPAHFVLVPVKAGQPKVFPPDGLSSSVRGSFFPDGSKIAFEANAPGKGSRIYVQELSGGAPKPISEEGISPARIFVSPDGRWVAANGSDTRVRLFPAAGGTPTDLETFRPGDFPSGWTADSKGIYVSRHGIPCPVDLVDLASGRRTRVRELQASDASGVTIFGPARITPDGQTAIVGMNRILSTLYRVAGLK